MSSQPNTATVPFSISHTQQPIRLLELPPQILSLLSSPTPPTLKIKAAPTSSTKTRTPSTVSDHAVLCTTSKTYSIRQVHSSNTTFLLYPCDTNCGVTATSTITSYLELLPITPDASVLLRPFLLPYPPSTTPTTTGKSKAEIYHDLPVSDTEFSAAWAASAAFEHAGVAYAPSAAALLQAAKEALNSMIAEGISLTVPFAVADVVTAIDDPEVPAGLVASVVTQICDEGWVLNPERCVRVVGRWVLQAWTDEKGTGTDMLYIAFMSRWKAVVPDGCARLCRLETLKNCYTLPTPNTICYVPEGAEKKETTAGNTAALPPKNKWHEKFRQGKKP